MSWSRLSKVSLLGLSSGLGVGLGTSIYLNKEQLAKRHQVFNSWTTNTIVPECAVWDNNWDKRAPFSLVKPLKADASPEEENNYNAKIEKHKPTATRHLILIRHGQYNLAGATDPERILTELGRAQAKHTGERLTELKIPIDHVVISTMARAQETGKIILKCTQLSHLSLENDPLIEEGAPVAPEPPVGHWRPEPSVMSDTYHFKILRTTFYNPNGFYILAVFPRRRTNRSCVQKPFSSSRTQPEDRFVYFNGLSRECYSLFCLSGSSIPS